MNPYRYMVYDHKRWHVEEAVLSYMLNITRCQVIKPPREVWISPRNFLTSARRLAAKVSHEALPGETSLTLWMQWYTPAGALKVYLDPSGVDDQLDFGSGT